MRNTALYFSNLRKESNLQELVQFRGGQAAVEEAELARPFHLIGGFDETAHRGAIEGGGKADAPHPGRGKFSHGK